MNFSLEMIDSFGKLKQKFLVKKDDVLTYIRDPVEIVARGCGTKKLAHRLITSSRYIDQSLEEMDMEKCNPVSTPGLLVTERFGD